MKTILTAEQVAEVLGLHRSRIYTAINARLITPDAAVGRAKAFHRKSLSGILDRLTPYITAAEYAQGQENLKIYEQNSMQTKQITPTSDVNTVTDFLRLPPEERQRLVASASISSSATNDPATHSPICRPIALPPGCQAATKQLFREHAKISDPFTATKFIRDAVASGAWRMAMFDIERQQAANPGWQAPISKSGPRRRLLSPAELNHV